jgi:capsular exopolysaccharide synthesis family protein
MTRLSEALKRAAETAGQPVIVRDEPPAGPWQFGADDREPGTVLAARDEPAHAMPLTPSPRVERAAAGTPAALAARFSAVERSRLVVSGEAGPTLVEQYRHLAAVLHHAQSESGCRSVMVTSALPSEGKTLTATNLALTISESYERRVLLIDADLRRPRLQDVFGLAEGPGLTDSLNDPRGGKLPTHQISPTLWVLTAGRATANPMSTLVSAAMKHLLHDAREAFDWVIVDTPPIAILPDANLLASMIDAALLVVSADKTPYPMVQRAVQAIGPSRILGVVLNRAESAGATAGYGYYPQKLAASGPEPRRRWSRWFRSSRGVPHVQ